MSSLRTYSAFTHPQAAALALPLDQILNAARLGDANAFNRLIDRYSSAALRLAEQILRTEEAAADAVQEALIKAYGAMSRFEDGNFRSWLLRIVANTCYDHLRRQKRRRTLSLDEMIDNAGADFSLASELHTENPEQTVMQRETMRLILNAIEELPVWHRSVVLMIDVQGYDYAEAAAMLKLPLGTVKSRLSRARAALRDRLVETRLIMPA